jgi:2-polyprenyl-6-methoxyphenol hydroxylase-like FAD-dependent oxidoreductase
VRTADVDLDCDLLVIADGAHSRLREQFFPSNAGLQRYAGYTTWRMLAVRPHDAPNPAETWGAAGQRFVVLPCGNGEVYCYATANVERGQHVEDEREELARRFGSWHRPIRQIIDSLAHGGVIRTDVYEMSEPLTSCHRGRALLLGDAAHAMTPDLGRGGCQALEDAATLGALLLTRTPIDDALERYSAPRVPRGSDLLRRSHQAGRIYQAPAGIARTVASLAALLPASLVARALSPVLDWQPPEVRPSHAYVGCLKSATTTFDRQLMVALSAGHRLRLMCNQTLQKAGRPWSTEVLIASST